MVKRFFEIGINVKGEKAWILGIDDKVLLSGRQLTSLAIIATEPSGACFMGLQYRIVVFLCPLCVPCTKLYFHYLLFLYILFITD